MLHDLMTLSQACRHLPKRRRGKKPSTSTLWRWCVHGLNGVRLECVVVGGQRMVSLEMLERFFARLTQAADKSVPRESRPSDDRRHAGVEKLLERAGI